MHSKLFSADCTYNYVEILKFYFEITEVFKLKTSWIPSNLTKSIKTGWRSPNPAKTHPPPIPISLDMVIIIHYHHFHPLANQQLSLPHPTSRFPENQKSSPQTITDPPRALLMAIIPPMMMTCPGQHRLRPLFGSGQLGQTWSSPPPVGRCGW